MVRSACVLVLLGAMASGAPGCRKQVDPKGEKQAPPAASAPDFSARRNELLGFEHRRTSKPITTSDLTHADLGVRRQAARALSRIADDRAHELLLGALADSDPEVTSWAAYGLGYACAEREASTVRALAVRATSLLEAGAKPPRADELLHPVRAIFDALARCASAEAQRVLGSWLGSSWPAPLRRLFAEEAALGLGKLASRTGRLDDAAIVALLDAADDPNHPLESALFVFSRLGPLEEAVQHRILEVAKPVLPRAGRARTFALRALGKAGPKAAPLLAAALADASFDATDRVAAARSLGELGEAGQEGLAGVIGDLAPAGAELARGNFGRLGFAPLVTSLEALKPSAALPLSALGTLAAAPIPENERLARRVVRLRCLGASLLAGATPTDKRLGACDPGGKSRFQALARLAVLDRTKVVGPARRHWLELVAASDPAVREAALDMMARHPEIDDPATVLAEHLADPNPGVVASAAGALATFPDRGSGTLSAPVHGPDGTLAPRPDAHVSDSLRRAFDRVWPPDAIETETALIDAAGALELMVLKPKLEAYCASPNPTLRGHAEKALQRLAGAKRRCPPPVQGYEPRPLPAPPATLRLAFTTDAGVLPMTLDSRFAPLTVAEVEGLVRSGFYDGILVHRVVPGFVVQFGDPDGDGYGGAPRAPLPCETTPVPFEAWNVGVALAGRDTGTSQLFVTLGPFPHLDGNYAWLGRASQAWQELDRNDRILKAVVVE